MESYRLLGVADYDFFPTIYGRAMAVIKCINKFFYHLVVSFSDLFNSSQVKFLKNIAGCLPPWEPVQFLIKSKSNERVICRRRTRVFLMSFYYGFAPICHGWIAHGLCLYAWIRRGLCRFCLDCAWIVLPFADVHDCTQ